MSTFLTEQHITLQLYKQTIYIAPSILKKCQYLQTFYENRDKYTSNETPLTSKKEEKFTIQILSSLYHIYDKQEIIPELDFSFNELTLEEILRMIIYRLEFINYLQIDEDALAIHYDIMLKDLLDTYTHPTKLGQVDNSAYYKNIFTSVYKILKQECNNDSLKCHIFKLLLKKFFSIAIMEFRDISILFLRYAVMLHKLLSLPEDSKPVKISTGNIQRFTYLGKEFTFQMGDWINDTSYYYPEETRKANFKLFNDQITQVLFL